MTKARRALLNPVESVDSADALRAALSALDRAAEKGILHANNARRRKSRLATMAASLQLAGQAGEGEAAVARSAAAGGAKGRTTKAAAAKAPAKSAAKPAKTSAKSAAKSTAKATTAKATTAKATTAKASTAKSAKK